MKKLNEECGIFGIYNHKDCINLSFLGLYSLQHRGQESVGIVYNNKQNKLKQLKGLGLVSEFVKKIDIKQYKGNFSIGHVRYSTTGSTSSLNIQPLLIDSHKGLIGLAHNGNLINAKEIRDNLRKTGSIFQTTVDSEVILHIMAKSRKKNIADSAIEALNKIKGGYSLLFITKEGIMAARDPMGLRPLWIGKLNRSFIVSSEDSALKIINAKPIREIKPGEIVVINQDGIKSIQYAKSKKINQCVFELIYFARPDSTIFDFSVNKFREECGRQLVKESKVDADIVIAVPDSGNYAALGYSKESKIPFEMGLVRNHYIGRTFIQNTELIRENDVMIKLMPVSNILKNKKVVIIDDSIVRGTTSKKIVKILKQAGAKEVHFRIASPPYAHSCYYGIDTPDESKFIIHNHTIKGVEKFLGVDSLSYLSICGLQKILGNKKNKFCYACFNNKYPIQPKVKLKKEILE